MFIIFGTKGMRQTVEVNRRIVCPICQNDCFEFIKTYQCFSLFFIPIPFLSWDKRYFAVCKNCGTTLQFRNGFNSDYIIAGAPRRREETKVRCRFCGSLISESNSYCPECGNKQ